MPDENDLDADDNFALEVAWRRLEKDEKDKKKPDEADTPAEANAKERRMIRVQCRRGATAEEIHAAIINKAASAPAPILATDPEPQESDDQV